jgi:hypothetical protein
MIESRSGRACARVAAARAGAPAVSKALIASSREARRRPLAARGEHVQIGGPTQVTTVRLLGSAGSRPPAT